jgi:hypothetical protein
MTSKAALCKALLEGQVVNIMNGFKLFGITNIPREIGRSIERCPKKTKNKLDGGFDVKVSRVNRTGKSRYGTNINWVDYRLNFTNYNKKGIKKMKEYVYKQIHLKK